MWFMPKKRRLHSAEEALPGRSHAMPVAPAHTVNGHKLQPPFPAGMESIVLGLGCFWGAERLFWRLPGIYTTAAGYAGGLTPNPTYEEVCSGMTGHTEAVLVVFDPGKIALSTILRTFWEGHDPTQGMRQGNDTGTQYRSAIYWTEASQERIVRATAESYGKVLAARGLGPITTEMAPAGAFYYAEDYHQQYLDKNHNGYCGLGGTGIACPGSEAGIGAAPAG
jgi:peptide-methionine (S)-S-oxide reductase